MMMITRIGFFRFIFSAILFSYIFLRTVIPYHLADLALLGLLTLLLHKIKYRNLQALPLLALALFAISLIVSASFNSVSFSLLDYVRVFTYLAIMMLLLGLTDFINYHKEDFYKVVKLFILIAAIYSAISLLAFFLFYAGKDYFNLNSFLYIRGGGERARLQGLFDNPNYFSFSMFFTYLVSFWMWRNNQISFFILGVILLTGLATLSRGYFLGFISFTMLYLVFIALSVFIRSDLKLNMRKFSVALIISSLFVVPASGFIYNKVSGNDKLSSVIEQRVFDQGGGASARLESITNWYAYGSDNFKQVLFGNGAGFFEYYSTSSNSAHNSFVRVLGEYGLIALLFFVCLLFFFTAPLVLRSKLTVFSLSSLLSLMLVLFTNDYYLVRDFWFLLFMIYISNFVNAKNKGVFYG